MYLVHLKTMVVDALQQAFNTSFLPDGYRGVHVSIEYPMEKQHYPGIWVNYEDQDSLSIAGIDQREFVYDNPVNPAAGTHEVTRWVFSGEVTLTFAALTSRERDGLYDQFVRVFAFSRMEGAQTNFRTIIENNDFIAANVNWDELRPHGDSAAPGTPWGTENEVIYEKSIGFDIEGEFISDPTTNTLLLLSRIQVAITNQDDPATEENPYTLGIPRTD